MTNIGSSYIPARTPWPTQAQGVPARSLPPIDPNSGQVSPMTPGSQAKTPGTPATKQTSPGGKYAWSDSPINLGPIQLGFGTRVLKNTAVIIVAIVLFILGIIAMIQPDLESLGKTVVKNIPI